MKGKRRGRPPIEDPANVPARLTKDCHAIIMSERNEEDRNISDTILRVFREKGRKIASLQKKVDALLEEQQLRRIPGIGLHNIMNERPNELLQVRRL